MTTSPRVAEWERKTYIRSSMALAISNIPILTGAAAESFVKNAEIAEWKGFETRNAERIAKLKAEGKWPF